MATVSHTVTQSPDWRQVKGGPGGTPRYLICMPEIAREMTSRWISEVPSKIV
jgi:hypothetical protein